MRQTLREAWRGVVASRREPFMWLTFTMVALQIVLIATGHYLTALVPVAFGVATIEVDKHTREN